MSVIGEPLSLRYKAQDLGFETPCWIWKRFFDKKGYGQMWSPVYKKVVRAHRHYYEHFVGPIPSNLQLDHLCRNAACVNPDHLEPVPQEINQRRGRACKLSDEQIEQIRTAEGSVVSIARRFGVSPSHTSAIRLGKERRVSSAELLAAR